MNYSDQQVAKVAEKLKAELASAEDKRSILRSNDLKALYAQISSMPEDQRAKYGEEVNGLRAELEALVNSAQDEQEKPAPIDLTAPFDVNQSVTNGPKFLAAQQGSKHPIMVELDKILDIYARMGFSAIESRQIDDDYHMFESLNFPKGHPARDDYDTFVTTEGLIAPAHTSTMQNRILKANKDSLDQGKPIAYVVPGRCFRNEDVDARHDHTFYQIEGVYVDKNINTGNLVAVLQTFFTDYYGKKMDVKIQPFYFPFTEPSFEFAISCPFCKDGETCHVCSSSRWIELLGCGMIHPNVLKEAGIDPSVYTGFAWGGGIERLVMIKYGIEDIRYFESGKLEFLRQF
jgi:phenylalanyl-tRNA synthetase alpha chain